MSKGAPKGIFQLVDQNDTIGAACEGIDHTFESYVDAVYIHAIPPSANPAHEALKRAGYNSATYRGPGVASQTFIIALLRSMATYVILPNSWLHSV